MASPEAVPSTSDIQNSAEDELCLGRECQLVEVVNLMLTENIRMTFSSEWPKLAAKLGLSPNSTANIKTMRERDLTEESTLSMILQKWIMLKTTRQASIKSLMKALKEAEFLEMADQLRKKYFPESESAEDTPFLAFQIEPSLPTTRINKMTIKTLCAGYRFRLSFALALTAAVVLTAAFLLYFKFSTNSATPVQTEFNSSNSLLEITVESLEELNDKLRKADRNRKVKLILMLNNPAYLWHNVPLIYNADLIQHIEIVGNFPQVNVPKFLCQINNTKSVEVDLPYSIAMWDNIFSSSCVYKNLVDIKITDSKASNEVPCYLFSLGDGFCTNFPNVRYLNITYGCMLIENRYELFCCGTLQKVSVQMLLPSDRKSALILGNKLPNVLKLDFRFYFDGMCPRPENINGLHKEIQSFVSSRKSVCVDTWSNCSLKSDSEAYSSRYCN